MLLIFFDGINFDFDGMEFVFEQQVLFRVDSLFDLRPQGLVPPGLGKGQNLEHLSFFLFFALNFLECNCQFKHQVLFRNDFLSVNSDCRFSALGWG